MYRTRTTGKKMKKEIAEGEAGGIDSSIQRLAYLGKGISIIYITHKASWVVLFGTQVRSPMIISYLLSALFLPVRLKVGFPVEYLW